MSAPVASTNRAASAGRPKSVQGTRQQLDELDALLQRMLDLPVTPDAAALERTREEEHPEPEPMPMPAPVRPARAPEPPRPPARRAYPPSYMVVETSTPPYLEQPEEHHEADLEPKQIEDPRDRLFEPPTPGGQHDFDDEPGDDPLGDLARLRARLESQEGGDWVPLRSSWQPSEQTWKPLAETWEKANTIPPPPEAPPAWPQQREDQPASGEVPFEPAVPPVHTVVPSPEAPRPPAVLLPLVWFNQAFDVFLYPLGPLGSWLRRPSGRGVLGTLGLLCLVAAAALAAAAYTGIEGLGWPQ
jgi:hypothetical protein